MGPYRSMLNAAGITSGATLSATAEAAHLAGAARINVVVLARVCKDV